MTAAIAYTAAVLILIGCITRIARVLPGRERLACLRYAISARITKGLLTVVIAIIGGLLKVTGPVITPAMRIVAAACTVARHPSWWARYARTRRHPAPGPGRGDGEELTREETQALGNLAAGRDVRSRT